MSSDSCIFCKICQGKQETEMIYSDDDNVVFSDIRPAAKHHYLIVPKIHISDGKSLTKEQIPLVENLVDLGKKILAEKGADLDDSRFGFHWPPFHSVSHLHLHAISPASQMSWIQRMIFKPGTLWFVTPTYVLQRLAKL